MEYVLNSRFAKEVDIYTSENKGLPSLCLMERAALEAAREVEGVVKKETRILVVCGTGNNGGDGLALARILFLRGYKTSVLLVGNPAKRSESLCKEVQIARNYSVPIREMTGTDPRNDSECLRIIAPGQFDYLVDAVFGIGLKREITGIFADVINAMNQSLLPVTAIDIPSGIHTDTGAVLGCAVKAEQTITFTAIKPGLLLYPGREFAGIVKVEEIGISLWDHADKIPGRIITREDLAEILRRDRNGNKGTFGKVVVFAGCETMYGAAYLSAQSALKSGCGMVKVITEEGNRAPLFATFPEVLADFWRAGTPIDPVWIEKQLAWADAVVIGPGLGQSEQAEQLCAYVFEHCAKPIVVDADACNLLSIHEEWIPFFESRPGYRIMTPHAGELSRLLAEPIAELKKDPENAAQKAAEKYHCSVLFKDSVSVLSEDPGIRKRIWYHAGGSSAMATAGSGDVLTGIMAAFLARRDLDFSDPDRRAALAVWVHGRCGETAEQKSNSLSVTAGDLCRALNEVLR